jgi:hypothetical protein
MEQPRNAKELARILANDPELKRAIHGVIARADHLLEKELLEAVREASRRNSISYSQLDHEDVTEGLKRCYKMINASGLFVRLY